MKEIRASERGGVGAAPLFGSLALAAVESRAALPVVDNCDEAAYQDRRAEDADRVLDWDFVIVGSPERCLKIRAGQSVQWVGSFATHPLGPDQGDVPNPVASHDPSGVVVFPSPGIFGYRCNTHFEMRGAIQVVTAPPAAPAMTPWTGVLLAALLTILGTAMLGYRSRA